MRKFNLYQISKIRKTSKKKPQKKLVPPLVYQTLQGIRIFQYNQNPKPKEIIPTVLVARKSLKGKNYKIMRCPFPHKLPVVKSSPNPDSCNICHPSLTEFRQQLLRRKDPVRVVLAKGVKGPVQRLGDDPEVGVLGPHLQQPGGEESEDGGRAWLRHPLGR